MIALSLPVVVEIARDGGVGIQCLDLGVETRRRVEVWRRVAESKWEDMAKRRPRARKTRRVLCHRNPGFATCLPGTARRLAGIALDGSTLLASMSQASGHTERVDPGRLGSRCKSVSQFTYHEHGRRQKI